MRDEILSYETHVNAKRYRWWFWMIPAALGILQIPRDCIVSWHVMDWQSLRPVSFLRDSLLYALELLATFVALSTAGIGIGYGLRNRHKLAVIVCAIVILVSLLILFNDVSDWYQNVYRAVPGATWGQW